MRTNYVLVDFENVQPEGLASLQQDCFKVIIFLGVNQTKIPVEIAQGMQALGNRGCYVRILGSGSNALDFHIAYYLGQLAAKEPGAYFHIISKDTGFDPLIAYLKNSKVDVVRENAISEIPLLKQHPPCPPVVELSPSKKADPDARYATILEKLRSPKATKPRTVKTLTSHVKASFAKGMSDAEVDSLIKELRRRGMISISEDNKITYHLQ